MKIFKFIGFLCFLAALPILSGPFKATFKALPAGLRKIPAITTSTSKSMENQQFYKTLKWKESLVANERDRLISLGFDAQKSAIAASVFGPKALQKINTYPEEYYKVAKHFIDDYFPPIRAWDAVVKFEGNLELVRQELIPTVGSAINK